MDSSVAELNELFEAIEAGLDCIPAPDGAVFDRAAAALSKLRAELGRSASGRAEGAEMAAKVMTRVADGRLKRLRHYVLMLRRYGAHDAACGSRLLPACGCDCGFADVLAALTLYDQHVLDDDPLLAEDRPADLQSGPRENP